MNIKPLLQRLAAIEQQPGERTPRIILHDSTTGPETLTRLPYDAQLLYPHDCIIVISAWGLSAKYHQPD